MSKAISVQCKAISKNSGKQCKRKAIPGATVCRYHGGGAQQVKAKAAVRAELLVNVGQGAGSFHSHLTVTTEGKRENGIPCVINCREEAAELADVVAMSL